MTWYSTITEKLLLAAFAKDNNETKQDDIKKANVQFTILLSCLNQNCKADESLLSYEFMISFLQCLAAKCELGMEVVDEASIAELLFLSLMTTVKLIYDTGSTLREIKAKHIEPNKVIDCERRYLQPFFQKSETTGPSLHFTETAWRKLYTEKYQAWLSPIEKDEYEKQQLEHAIFTRSLQEWQQMIHEAYRNCKQGDVRTIKDYYNKILDFLRNRELVVNLALEALETLKITISKDLIEKYSVFRFNYLNIINYFLVKRLRNSTEEYKVFFNEFQQKLCKLFFLDDEQVLNNKLAQQRCIADLESYFANLQDKTQEEEDVLKSMQADDYYCYLMDKDVVKLKELCSIKENMLAAIKRDKEEIEQELAAVTMTSLAKKSFLESTRYPYILLQSHQATVDNYNRSTSDRCVRGPTRA